MEKRLSSNNKEKILQKRQEVEQELLGILKETESDFGLENIKDIIFNEDGQDCLNDVIAIFDRGGDISELENILELVNDAWNYFPHKLLGGLSPAEKVLEKKGQNFTTKSIYDEYRPRDEYEMCDLFSALLFMKTDEIIPGQMSQGDTRAKKLFDLSEKEMEWRVPRGGNFYRPENENIGIGCRWQYFRVI